MRIIIIFAMILTFIFAMVWSSVKISDSDFEKILPLSYAAMLLSVACCM